MQVLQREATGVEAPGSFGIYLEASVGDGARWVAHMLAQVPALAGTCSTRVFTQGDSAGGGPARFYIAFHAAGAAPDPVPNEEANVIGIFREWLAPAESVTAGLHPGGLVLLNSRRSPQAVRELLSLRSGRIGVVDASGIALAERSHVSAVMLGAICRVTPHVDPHAMAAHIGETCSSRSPRVVARHLQAFARGFNEVTCD